MSSTVWGRVRGEQCNFPVQTACRGSGQNDGLMLTVLRAYVFSLWLAGLRGSGAGASANVTAVHGAFSNFEPEHN